jgi:hypothetical protein
MKVAMTRVSGRHFSIHALALIGHPSAAFVFQATEKIEGKEYPSSRMGLMCIEAD